MSYLFKLHNLREIRWVERERWTLGGLGIESLWFTGPVVWNWVSLESLLALVCYANPPSDRGMRFSGMRSKNVISIMRWFGLMVIIAERSGRPAATKRTTIAIANGEPICFLSAVIYWISAWSLSFETALGGVCSHLAADVDLCSWLGIDDHHFKGIGKKL